MLNESLFSSSFDELKYLLLHNLTIFHVAIIYVLMYVLYKALGRYIYFKPHEHAAKINRTFLTLSILIVLLNSLRNIISYLPFLPEYRWFFMLGALILLITPFSILIYWIIWGYGKGKYRNYTGWHYDYLQIASDYYETPVPKSETKGSISTRWEEKGIESTNKNIHSDVLLNLLALIIFIIVGLKWANDSATYYGHFSYIFSVATSLAVGGIFLDHTIFAWILYLEKNIKNLWKKIKKY